MFFAIPLSGKAAGKLAHAGREMSKGGAAVGVAAILLACLPAVGWGQSSAPAGGLSVPAMSATTAPATAASAPASVAAEPAAPVVTQAFVGRVAATHVYVRSGPGVNYYELGQLGKGDLVSVVGQKLGWYQILPPEGTYFYIAKDYVDADAGGTSGRADKAPFVNVRAASALHPNSDYAILGSIRKGTPLTLLGTQTVPGTPAKEYYKVAPPAGIAVYVKPDLVVTAASGTEYKTAMLQVPGGVATPAHVAAADAGAATRPGEGNDTLVVRAPVAATEGAAATGPAEGGTPPEKVVVVPQPAVQFSQDATQRFEALNRIAQAEFQKPLLQRDLQSLLKDFQALAKQPNLPPSVKQGTDQRIGAIEKIIKLQTLAKEADVKNDTAFQDQQKAYQQQWEAAQEKITEMEKNGPQLAEGRLQTSSVVRAKYVLVDPATGRVQAYVDPAAEIDLSKLLGQYIGVRGSEEMDKDLHINVIKVSNATVMAAPKKTEAAK